MKKFSDFLLESEQQGALASHLARTAADRSAKSGTVGGSVARFKKRRKTGLGSAAMNLAKRAGQSIKNSGKGANTTSDTTYRGKGAGRVEVVGKKAEPKGSTKALKPASDRSAIKQGAKKIAYKALGSAVKKAALKAASDRKKISSSPNKSTLPAAAVDRKKISSSPNKSTLPAAKKALPPAKKALPAAR